MTHWAPVKKKRPLGRKKRIAIYQGQYYDPELDLCYNRYRYFNPQICSFISQDPLGLAAGENVYAYGPNVWGWVDPLGLACEGNTALKLPPGNPPTRPPLKLVVDNTGKIAKVGRYAKFGRAVSAGSKFLGLIGAVFTAKQVGTFIGEKIIGPALYPSQMTPYETPDYLKVTNYIDTDENVIATNEGFFTSQGRQVNAGEVADWMDRRSQAGLTGGLVNKIGDGPKTTDPSRTRLPRTKGRWDGEPGNGKWYSDKPEVIEATGGKPIPFKNGRPDFSEFSKGRIKFKPGELKGTNKDFDLVYEKVKNVKGLSSRNAAKQYLKQKGLTPHHVDGSTIELVPTKIHGNVPHIGSASDLRLR